MNRRVPHHRRLGGDHSNGVTGRLRHWLYLGFMVGVRRAAEGVRGRRLLNLGSVHVTLAATDVAVIVALLLAGVGVRSAVNERLLGEASLFASRVQSVHVDEGRVAGVLLRPLLEGCQAVQSAAPARVLNAVRPDQVSQRGERGTAEPVRQQQRRGPLPSAGAGGTRPHATQT